MSKRCHDDEPAVGRAGRFEHYLSEQAARRLSIRDGPSRMLMASSSIAIAESRQIWGRESRGGRVDPQGSSSRLAAAPGYGNRLPASLSAAPSTFVPATISTPPDVLAAAQGGLAGLPLPLSAAAARPGSSSEPPPPTGYALLMMATTRLKAATSKYQMAEEGIMRAEATFKALLAVDQMSQPSINMLANVRSAALAEVAAVARELEEAQWFWNQVASPAMAPLPRLACLLGPAAPMCSPR